MTDNKIKDKVVKFKNSKDSVVLSGSSASVGAGRFKEATFNLMGALESRGIILGDDKSGKFNSGAAKAGAAVIAKENAVRAAILSDKSKQTA